MERADLMQTVLTVLSIVASLATIIAIFFGAWQIKLGAEQVRIARETDEAENAWRIEEQRQLRETLLMALALEIQAIEESMNLDERLFHPESGMQDDRTKERHISMATEGQSGYTRGYVWTPLPLSTIEQAIHEAYLLGLTEGQVGNLQTLRQGILRANTAATAKDAAMPAFLAGQSRGTQGLSMTYQRTADARMDNLNMQIQTEFRLNREVCKQIAAWVEGKRAAK